MAKGKTYTYKGETGSLSHLCRVFNKNYSLCYKRLESGDTIEGAFERPKSERFVPPDSDADKVYEYEGLRGSLSNLCRQLNLNRTTIKYRLDAGYTLEQALTNDKKGFKVVQKRFCGRQYTYNGVTGNIEYLSYINNIESDLVKWRLEENISLSDAFAPFDNKKLHTYQGKTGAVKELCNFLGLDIVTVKKRLDRKYSDEQAFDPNGRAKKYTYKGITDTLINLCEHFGCNISTVRKRLDRGYPIEVAMQHGRLNAAKGVSA